jgi:NADH-quinone oxidoreductase subunit I
MLNALWDNIKGIYSLLVGMSITGRFLFSPRKTIHYPRKVVDEKTLASYRGPLELIPSPENPGLSRCISCQMCVKACPGHCLTVTKSQGAKSPCYWHYDFTLCCLCGACVETCPAGALRFSHKVYMVAKTRKEMDLDLLADLKNRAAKRESA